MTRFRKWACRWFSFHDQVVKLNHGGYELSECRYCGLRAAVHHDTRHCIILGVK